MNSTYEDAYRGAHPPPASSQQSMVQKYEDDRGGLYAAIIDEEDEEQYASMLQNEPDNSPQVEQPRYQQLEEKQILAGSKQDPEQIEEMRQNAQNFLKEKKYVESVQIYNKILMRHYELEGISVKHLIGQISNLIKRFNHLSMVLLNQEKFKQCKKLLQTLLFILDGWQRTESAQGEAIEVTQMIGLTLNNLSCAYKRQGFIKQAEECLNQALQFQELDSMKYLNLQEVGAFSDEEVSGIDNENNQIIKNESALTMMNLCTIYSQKKQYKKAMDFADSAISKLKQELRGYHTTFWTMIDNKNQTGVIERDKVDGLVQTAREKQSLLAICFYNKGCQQEYMDNNEDALQTYKIALKLEKTKQDPLKMGPDLMTKLRIADDEVQNQNQLSLIQQFQRSIQQVSENLRKQKSIERKHKTSKDLNERKKKLKDVRMSHQSMRNMNETYGSHSVTAAGSQNTNLLFSKQQLHMKRSQQVSRQSPSNMNNVFHTEGKFPPRYASKSFQKLNDSGAHDKQLQLNKSKDKLVIQPNAEAFLVGDLNLKEIFSATQKLKMTSRPLSQYRPNALSNRPFSSTKQRNPQPSQAKLNNFGIARPFDTQFALQRAQQIIKKNNIARPQSVTGSVQRRELLSEGHQMDRIESGAANNFLRPRRSQFISSAQNQRAMLQNFNEFVDQQNNMPPKPAKLPSEFIIKRNMANKSKTRQITSHSTRNLTSTATHQAASPLSQSNKVPPLPDQQPSASALQSKRPSITLKPAIVNLKWAASKTSSRRPPPGLPKGAESHAPGPQLSLREGAENSNFDQRSNAQESRNSARQTDRVADDNKSSERRQVEKRMNKDLSFTSMGNSKQIDNTAEKTRIQNSESPQRGPEDAKTETEPLNEQTQVVLDQNHHEISYLPNQSSEIISIQGGSHLMKLIDNNFDRIQQRAEDNTQKTKRKSSIRSINDKTRLSSSKEAKKLKDIKNIDLNQLYRKEQMRQKQIQIDNMKLPQLSIQSKERSSSKYQPSNLPKLSRRNGPNETNSLSKKNSLKAVDMSEVNKIANDIQVEQRAKLNARIRRPRPATANMKKKLNLINERDHLELSKKSLQNFPDHKIQMMESIEHLLKQNSSWANDKKVQNKSVKKQLRRPFSANQMSMKSQGQDILQAQKMQSNLQEQVLQETEYGRTTVHDNENQTTMRQEKDSQGQLRLEQTIDAENATQDQIRAVESEKDKLETSVQQTQILLQEERMNQSYHIAPMPPASRSKISQMRRSNQSGKSPMSRTKLNSSTELQVSQLHSKQPSQNLRKGKSPVLSKSSKAQQLVSHDYAQNLNQSMAVSYQKKAIQRNSKPRRQKNHSMFYMAAIDFQADDVVKQLTPQDPQLKSKQASSPKIASTPGRKQLKKSMAGSNANYIRQRIDPSSVLSSSVPFQLTNLQSPRSSEVRHLAGSVTNPKSTHGPFRPSSTSSKFALRARQKSREDTKGTGRIGSIQSGVQKSGPSAQRKRQKQPEKTPKIFKRSQVIVAQMGQPSMPDNQGEQVEGWDRSKHDTEPDIHDIKIGRPFDGDPAQHELNQDLLKECGGEEQQVERLTKQTLGSGCQNQQSQDKQTLEVNVPDFASQKDDKDGQTARSQMINLINIQQKSDGSVAQFEKNVGQPLQQLASSDHYQINNEIGFFQEQSQALGSIDVSDVRESPMIARQKANELRPSLNNQSQSKWVQQPSDTVIVGTDHQQDQLMRSSGGQEFEVSKKQLQLYQEMIPKSSRESLDPYVNYDSIKFNPNSRAYKTSKKLKLDSIRQNTVTTPQAGSQTNRNITYRDGQGESEREKSVEQERALPHHNLMNILNTRHAPFVRQIVTKMNQNVPHHFFKLKHMRRANCRNINQIAVVFIQRWWRSHRSRLYLADRIAMREHYRPRSPARSRTPSPITQRIQACQVDLRLLRECKKERNRMTREEGSQHRKPFKKGVDQFEQERVEGGQLEKNYLSNGIISSSQVIQQGASTRSRKIQPRWITWNSRPEPEELRENR